MLAAASLAGREVFGWGGELGEHLSRIGLAATLANGAGLLVQLAVDLNNQICEAIGGTAMQPPFGAFNFDPPADSILLIVLLFFGLKLAFKMVYRIGMLWVLIPLAPIALACWAVPQTQWVATTWTRLFVGWTFGQVLVTIALKLGTVVGPLGPSGMHDAGFIFSIAMAALACDLADVLVRASGHHFGGGASCALRTAAAVGQAFAGVARVTASPQMRMPGF